MARQNLHLINLLLLIFGTFVQPQLHPQGDPSKSKVDLKIVPVLNESLAGAKAHLHHNENVKIENKTIVTNVTDTLANIEDPKIDKTLEEKTVEIESGAIYRGILVFVTCGLIFILYVGIKTCSCLTYIFFNRRRKYDKSRTIIRKYGVRTNRSDLEMEPLPLSDDDEDETVFDLTLSRLPDS